MGNVIALRERAKRGFSPTEVAGLTSNDLAERRHFLRFPCSLPLYRNGRCLGRAIDISLGGICFETETKFRSNEISLFQLETPLKRVSFHGKIIQNYRKRSRERFMGLRFSSLDDNAEKTLRAYFSLQHKVKGPSYLNTRAEFPFRILSDDGQLNQKCGIEPDEDFTAVVESVLDWLSAIDIGSDLHNLAIQYAKVGDRDPFLWKWGYAAVWLTTLDGVNDVVDVCRTKLATLMLTVLIDDLADKYHNSKAITNIYNYILHQRPLDKGIENGRWSDYLRLASNIWQYVQKRISTYQNFALLRKVLEFDYEQLFNSMRYSMLSNEVPSFANLNEYFLYQPPNVDVMIHGTIDLMNHPTFDVSELGKIRRVVWLAQDLARIANALATWERELDENDFSSAVFAYAMDKGIVSQKDWNDGNAEVIREKISQSDYRRIFFSEWIKRYNRLVSCLKDANIKSIDLTSFVTSMPRLLVDLHLSMQGRI